MLGILCLCFSPLVVVCTVERGLQKNVYHELFFYNANTIGIYAELDVSMQSKFICALELLVTMAKTSKRMYVGRDRIWHFLQLSLLIDWQLDS